MSVELRPMGAGELLDRALRMSLRHYGLLLALAMVLAVPAALGTQAIGTAMGPAITDWNPETNPNPGPDVVMQFALFSMAVGMLQMVAAGVAQGAVYHAVSKLYLGQAAEFGASLGSAIRRVVPLVVVNFLYGIIMAIGCGCIVGFFIFWAAFACCIAAVILENRGPIAALERSWHLTKNHRMRVMGTLGVAYVLVVLFNITVSQGAQAAGFGFVAQNVMTQIAAALVTPFYSVVAVLIYYDLRVKKEAFDLQVLAREFSTDSPMPEGDRE